MEAIEETLRNYEIEHHLSGAILISKDHNVIFEKAYGKASIQLDVPNTLETKFHIASETKMFIAAAALKLEEKGLLNLYDAPETYIKELKKLHPKITLYHLLNHTSGLYDIYAVPNLRYEMYKLQTEEGDFLACFAGQEQLFEPGQKWSYIAQASS